MKMLFQFKVMQKWIPKTVIFVCVCILCGCSSLSNGVTVQLLPDDKYWVIINRQELVQMGYIAGSDEVALADFAEKVVVQKIHNCADGYNFNQKAGWYEGSEKVGITYSCRK